MVLRVRGASLTWVLVLSSLLLTGLNPAGATAGHAASAAASMPRPRHLRVPRAVPHAVPAAYGALPLSFEPNQGQTDPQVAFLARAPGYQLFLTASGAVLNVVSVQRSAPGRAMLPGTALTGTTTISGTVLRLRYLGATAAPQIAGQDALPGTANYLVGSDTSAWHTRIPTYSHVTYHALYPGIDLGYDGTQGRLETSYTLAPGADPGAIQLSIAGAQSVQVDAHGALVLQTAQGSIIQAAPVAYQDIGGQRQAVTVHYVLSSSTQVGFAVGAYDHSQPLLIDPTLSYSTYLGGSGNDYGSAIAVDASGDAYVTGNTASSTFPTTTGAYATSFSGGSGGCSPAADAFVTKFNAAGTALVYSTYLGGSQCDEGHGIVVDSSGDAYVVGDTSSTNFPTVNAYQSSNGGSNNFDIFVSELNAAGSSLLYSTYLGGSGNDYGYGLARDSSGKLYIVGESNSGTGTFTAFPTKNPYQASNAGGQDVVVAKLDPTASPPSQQLLYGTYLGGSGNDYANAIAMDSSGAIYLAGSTNSSNYPTTSGAYQTACADSGCANGDAYITKLNAAGSALVYSTYLGGNGQDGAAGLALDSSGDAYFTGATTSTNFPLHNALSGQTTLKGLEAAFVTELNASGNALVYSTYLGGSYIDVGEDLALDGSGNAAVTGYTYSTDFPLVTPLQSSNAGAPDVFVSSVASGGGSLLFSSYLGGTAGDLGSSLTTDSSGALYLTGNTASSTFPTTTGAFQGSLSGGSGVDAFVAKISGVGSGGSGAGGGAIPWHPHHTVRFSDHLSASIDLADGHVDVSAADLSIPGRGPDVAITHVWDSIRALAALTTTAGAGWVSSLTPRMSGVLTGTVNYLDETAATWPFTYSGTLGGTNSYSTTPGLPWQLTTSSAGYTLTNILSSETLTFDSQGRYLADTDSYGNNNTLAYSSGLPIGDTNSGDRALAMTYTAGLLSEVSSPLWRASGATLGQHVSYGYSGSQLVMQTLGAGSTDALTATFGYQGSELVTVTTPYTQSIHAWTLGYDASGRVTSITSPISGSAGQTGYTPAYTTSISYGPTQTVVIEGAGTSTPLTTTYMLDGQGQATAIADGLGETTRYSYDGDHDVLTTTDANNNIITNTYQYVGATNNVGLVTQTVKPPIAPFAFGNDPLALTPITLTYTYDPQTHDLTETHNVNSDATTFYAYDAHHSVITTTQLLDDSGGGCFIAPPRRAGPYRRPPVDTHGRLIGLSCTPTFVWRASVNSYDPYGERVSSIDGRGLSVPTTHDFNPVATLNTSGIYGTDVLTATYATHSYTYTTQGDLAKEWTPPIVTTLYTVTTTGPVTTTYGYDLDGNRTSLLSANNFGTSNATTYGYDHIGRLITTTLPPVLLYTNVVSSPVETTSYDGEGNVVQQVDGNGDVTTSSYDPLDRQVATTDPVSGTSLITYTATEKVAEQDPHGYVTLDNYDGAGRLLLETDPLSGTTQYQYDPVGNTVAITGGTASAATQIETRQYDALNEVITDTLLAPSQPPSTTATSYDTDGNVVFTEQPNGDQTGDAYDRADQLLQTWVLPLSGPAGPYENYSYDHAGNQTEYDDMDSRVHQASYDGDDRLIQTVDTYTSTNTLTTTYGYDPDGNIISQVETSVVGHTTRTHSTTNSYNVVDWRTGSTDTPASGAALPTSYGYDGAGQERSETVIDGVTPVTMTLDAEGRTTAIAEGYGSSGPYTTSYGYDPNDLPISATLPGSIQDNWGYDQNNRLVSSSLVGPSGVITPLNSQYGYGYNALGWTTAVTTTLSGVGSTQTITHDALGRMTGESSPGSTQSWSYDGNGNLLTSVNNGATTTYASNSSVPNEVQSTTTGGVTTAYSYDQNGDTTSITNTSGTVNTSLSYDSQARLSVVTLKDGSTVSMSYDAVGQRASYVVSKGGVSSLTEQFTYRGDELAQAVISATQKYTDTYLYDPNGAPLELLRQYQNGTTGRYWYVLDGRGNVVALTGINGNVVDSYSYDAWGKLLSASEAVPQRLRYAGYWDDQELGWYWVSVREYAPGLKRWLQPDQSEIDGVRTYVYVGDDPIDVSDPSGLGPGASQSEMCRLDQRYCSGGSGNTQVAQALYMFAIGDDLNGLQSGNVFVAGLAVFDIASNALVFIPAAGDFVRVGIKGITEGAVKALTDSVEHAGEHVAESTAEQTGKRVATRTSEIHHFATNKHSFFTPQMQQIADQYGLDLDGAWNKELLLHRGRHVTQYHQFVLDAMRRAAHEAGDNTERFLELFEKYVKEPVRNNPDILYRRGWQG